MKQKPCTECSAQLAADQRYCLNCGKRVGRLTLPGALALPRPAAAVAAISRSAGPSWLPLSAPGPRLGAVLTAAALGLGLYVGGLVSGGYPGTTLATGSPLLGDVLPGTDNGSSGDASTATLQAPVGNTGGGGGAAPATAPAPAAPVVAATPAPAATSTPTRTDSGGGGKQTKPKPQSVSGTVVHVNPNARSYLLASSGTLLPIHAKSLPDAGSKVKTPIEPLSNGTFAENGKRSAGGRSQQAEFSGTVTFRDAEAHSYSVSGRGYSVLVEVPADGSQPPDPPQLGAEIDVTVGISIPAAARSRAARRGERDPADPLPDPAGAGVPAPADPWQPSCPPPGTAPVAATDPAPAVLNQQSVTVDGQATGTVDVEAIVQSACPEGHQLALSADDLRQAGEDLVLTVPEGIDVARITAGRSYALTATIGPDGSYALTGLVSDDGSKGADDPSTAQGDEAG